MYTEVSKTLSRNVTFLLLKKENISIFSKGNGPSQACNSSEPHIRVGRGNQ